MLITKVTRSYSRSINARNYGAPESWVKVEATYEATCETSDNPLEVSKMVYEQCKKDVVDACNEITTKMKQANQNMRDGMNPAPLTPSSPATVVPGGAPRSL